MKLEFNHSWEPFTVNHSPFIYASHFKTRLINSSCSHWGPVIYKWQGVITQQGHEYEGKMGILIGETQNLRSRLKQYSTGTQHGGNLWWRNQFLECGSISFHVLNIKDCFINGQREDPRLESKNWRLVLEQLLVLESVRSSGSDQWIVNRMQ
jgi:hypothetical protein